MNESDHSASAQIASPAIRWYGDRLSLLDQRALPHQELWLTVQGAEDSAAAIRDMVVRGAPAIGIVAAYGVALAARSLGDTASAATLTPAIETLAASRPTAVNLFWALARMRTCCLTGEPAQQADSTTAGSKNSAATAAGVTTAADTAPVGAALIRRLMAEAEQIHRDDYAMNLQLAEHGVALLPVGKQVYTHCNTGALATGGHGTALGIIRSAWQAGRISGVIAGETRPWLQGARLTAWELMQEKIPVTLVVDSAAGPLLQSGDIGAVIVGADRITANGDTANKIGTYNLAVLARFHGIPFIVAAPLSTIDASLANGRAIAIEQRPASEVRELNGQPVAPADVPVHNPAFDVTPASLISAIVTERGVIDQPDADKLAAHLAAANA
mgnify:CR=1 FL=1